MSHFLISNLRDCTCHTCDFDALQTYLSQLKQQASLQTIQTDFDSDATAPTPPLLHLPRIHEWNDNVSRTLILTQARWPQTPTLAIFCSPQDTPADILEGIKAGVDDFLVCPFTGKDFIPRVQRLLLKAHDLPPNKDGAFSQERMTSALMIGRSPQFTALIEKIPLVARAEAPVLITGETGTGKELVARAIHYRSTRKGSPFIALNCSAIPDILLENELFGHISGAYTDARQAEPGLIAEAEGGTLFLDEIDSLSRAAQAKLLRFIQHREYRPLGSSHTKYANVRLLAATNADLRQRIQRGEFREDLYHRLNVITMTLPPLRERASDIPLLVRHFLSHYQAAAGGPPRQVTADAMEQLLRYPWPGNIRELESVLCRAIMTSGERLLSAASLDLPNTSGGNSASSASLRKAKQEAVEACERAYVINLMTRCEGNISQAARQAQIDRRALQRLLHKHQLGRHIFKHQDHPGIAIRPNP